MHDESGHDKTVWRVQHFYSFVNLSYTTRPHQKEEKKQININHTREGIYHACLPMNMPELSPLQIVIPLLLHPVQSHIPFPYSFHSHFQPWLAPHVGSDDRYLVATL
jgi:hypothetical protein